MRCNVRNKAMTKKTNLKQKYYEANTRTKKINSRLLTTLLF